MNCRFEPAVYVPIDIKIKAHRQLLHPQERVVERKQFLIPGSTVLTQLKDGETEKKGFFVYDTKTRTYEFVHINSRSFQSLKVDADSVKEGTLLREIEERVGDAVSKNGKGCIIRIEINGKSKAVKRIGIEMQEIAKKFKNDAVIEISKKGFDEVSDDEKRSEIFSDISKVSVKDLGIGILMAELKKNGYDLDIGPAELFEMLSSGEKKEKVIAKVMDDLLR